METGGASADKLDGLTNDCGKPAFVDVAHCKGMNSGAAYVETLDIIHAAQTDERHRGGLDLGRRATDTREFAGPHPNAAGEGHSVYIAAGAGRRRVHVGVRVYPDEAQLELSFAKVARHPGNSADRD